MAKTLTLNQYNDNNGTELNTFLNSLFDLWPGPFPYNPGPLFRAGLVNQIKAAETEGNAVPPTCWLVDNATVTLLVDVLQGYWNDAPVLANPSPRIIQSDREFIHFIRNYISQNNLEMRVPEFTCKKRRANAPSTYTLVRHSTCSFKDNDGAWNSAAVRQFLELLLAGAHFVVVRSATDLGNDMGLPPFFNAFSRLTGAGKAWHSHYSAVIATNGRNYPDLGLIEDEGDTLDKIKDDNGAVLLPVVLCDTTANEDPNAFFQMEGWRPGVSMFGKGIGYTYSHKVLLAGYRHGADFQTHQQTIWNISTYGASLFSEKRGAPIFLAPRTWMRKRTYLYSGFEGPKAGHKWFDPGLVEGLAESLNPQDDEQDNQEEPEKGGI